MKPPNKEAHPPATASAPEPTNLPGTSSETHSESNLNPDQLPAPITDCVTNLNWTLTQQAKAIASEYEVSLRTAYRHLARYTVPSLDRRLGQDGKTYPAHPRGQSTQTMIGRELSLMRQALNRANIKADRDGIYDDDIAVLRSIVSSAQSILNRWEVFK
ncbi:MAG: hypothetical protein WCH99_15915 [Verrucomicrobiota bacterium]